MLRPSTELCPGHRKPSSLAVGEYVRGPDVPAGFHFFGKLVYRTFVQVRVDGSINTVQIPFSGVCDLVDVWGCAQGPVTGAVQGTLHVHAWDNAGWSGAAGIRIRCKPDTGVLEVVSGAILEMGGASESRPFPDCDVEFVVFWTK